MTTLLNTQPREVKLQIAHAIAVRRARKNQEKTVYGIYRPTNQYGGELVKCLQEQNGEWVEVNKSPVVKIPEKLERALTTPKRFKVLFGGRSGAKTNTVGDIFISRAKDYGDKTLCLRELQNSIEDSVHTLLSSEIDRLSFSDFMVTQNAIRLKDEDVFKFRGMARNPEGMKSFHGFKYAWGEEAQSFSQESLEKLTPTIREDGSEIWLTLNPGSSEDPVSKRFLEPFYDDLLRNGYYEDHLHLIIWVNYNDNPWHSNELEQERLFDLENKPRVVYDHIWRGYYNDDIENGLIQAEWFDACVDAHKKLGFQPVGVKQAAHDPSDMGGDSKGYCFRHGSVVLDVQEKLSGSVNEGSRWAVDMALTAGADVYTWDADGMGIALVEEVSKSFAGKHTIINQYKGSESPDFPEQIYECVDNISQQRKNKDSFKNKRSQYYFYLRDRIYRTYRAVTDPTYSYQDPEKLISFSSDIKILDKLRAELCRIPVKDNGNGLFQLYSKPEMKSKFKLSSPNLADSVVMAFRYIRPTIQNQVRRPAPVRSVRSRR